MVNSYPASLSSAPFLFSFFFFSPLRSSHQLPPLTLISSIVVFFPCVCTRTGRPFRILLNGNLRFIREKCVEKDAIFIAIIFGCLLALSRTEIWFLYFDFTILFLRISWKKNIRVNRMLWSSLWKISSLRFDLNNLVTRNNLFSNRKISW